MSWNGVDEQMDEIFRNQTVSRTAILTKDQFKGFKFRFSSEEDPLTKQPIAIECTSAEFKLVAG